MTSRYGRLPWLFVGMFSSLPSFAQPPAPIPAPDALAVHWKCLLDTDAEKAYLAMRHMAATPKETLAFLREMEKPAAAVDAKVIEELIRQLSSDRFAIREKAVQELERHDRHAMPALKNALQGPIDLEAKRRIDALLARHEGRLTNRPMRCRRMIEIVEWIGTAEAKELLVSWSNGADDARVTHEARLSLSRWIARPKTDGFGATQEPPLDALGDPLPAGAILRLGTTRWRSGEPSLDRGTMQFISGGQFLVCDSEAFRVIDVRDGKTRSRIPFGASVNCALLTPDRQRLVATGHTRDENGAISPALCVWDLQDFKKAVRWHVEGSLLGFAQQGEIAVLAASGGIRQVDIKTGREVGFHPTPLEANPNGGKGPRQSLAVLNENLIAVPKTSESQVLRIYDWSAPEKARSLAISGIRDFVEVAMSPKNKYLAYTCRPGLGVRLVELAGLQEIRHLAPKGIFAKDEDNYRSSVTSLVFSPNGKFLAFNAYQYGFEPGNYDNSAVVVWDLESHTVHFKTSRGAIDLAFSPDSKFIAGRAGSARVLIWDTTTGKELTSGEGEPRLSIHKSSLRFLPDSRGLCLANQDDVRFWDFPSGGLRVALPHRDTRAVAVSPDSRLVATGSYYDRICVWDFATGKQCFQVPGPSNQNLFGVAFSPSSERLHVWADDDVLRSWDAKTGRLVAEHRPRPKGFPDLPDDDEGTNIQRERRREMRLRLASGSAVSLESSRLLWYFQGLHIFDTSSGKVIDVIDLDSRPYWLKTSTDLEWLLIMSSGRDKTITLYNLRQRVSFGRIGFGDSAPAGPVSMSPDGHSFAVVFGRPDRTIDIFETATLQRRFRISQEGGLSTELAFSPTGRYLAASQLDGTVLVYDLRGRP